MVVSILVFLFCFGGATALAASKLPELDPGPVAGLAFFAVCGLLGAAAGVAGLHIYLLVRGFEEIPGEFTKGDLFAGQVYEILFESGSLVGFACIVYLLAPRLDRSRPVEQPGD